MFEASGDFERFKLILRDFLISLKEFSVGDTADLFIDEKEAEMERRNKEEREAAIKVPVSCWQSKLSRSRGLVALILISTGYAQAGAVGRGHRVVKRRVDDNKGPKSAGLSVQCAFHASLPFAPDVSL
jgi:hypothetical protein